MIIQLRWYNCDDKIAMIKLRCYPCDGLTFPHLSYLSAVVEFNLLTLNRKTFIPFRTPFEEIIIGMDFLHFFSCQSKNTLFQLH